MTDARQTKIVRENRKEMGLSPDQPTRRYADDRGWSWEREQRMYSIGEALDSDRFASPPRPHSKELLTELRALIEETEQAVRDNPKTCSGTWLEQSKLCQGLLSSWFKATKDNF